MGPPDTQTVAVLGAGSMGHGIAELAALAGYDVVVRDIEQELVDEGLDDIEWSVGKLAEKGRIDDGVEDVMSRIEGTTDMAEAVGDADLVVEAVPEEMEIKRETFAEVDDLAPSHAILASNTSGLSITEMASATDRPERVVGTHYFNPPVQMDLVEVVHGAETSEETVETVHEYVESIDKTPIDVRKDVHGFVVNNVLTPLMEEPAWMLEAGETTVEQADAGMVFNRGYPMGPFELADYTGIDIGYHFAQDSRYEVPPPFARKVEEGNLGRKTGRGFYDYEEGEGTTYDPEDADGFDTLRVEARMVNEAARLVGEDVATPEDVDLGIRLGGSFPLGICRLGDKLGLDVVLEKVESLHETTGASRYEPADYLVECVEEGKTGEDAGEGFYSYHGEWPYQFLTVDVDEDGVMRVEFDRPTIAKIDGYCLGGGFEVALACDLRVATEGSTFGSPEITLGLIPGGGSTQRLTRLVGEARAKELIFRGQHIPAQQATDWGIINRAVPEEEFEETIGEFVDDIANGPKTALKVAKKVINEGQNASIDAGLAMESQGFGLLTTTEDMVEGVRAFQDDREPEFED